MLTSLYIFFLVSKIKIDYRQTPKYIIKMKQCKVESIKKLYDTISKLITDLIELKKQKFERHYDNKRIDLKILYKFIRCERY